MTNTWLARFANEPALVAPHLRDRFESSLTSLAALQHAELAAAKGEGDEFWTELGAWGSKRLRPYIVRNGVLMIPVKGVLLNGFPYQFFDYATGYEYIWKAFERGVSDPEVTGIALIIDSPGGMVAGNFDLVDRIFDARGTKPVRAFASESAYSAAYSIASAADRIVVARTGGVGSIGVVTSHVDVSKALDEAGYKVTFIFAGQHKVDGNPYEALPDDVKARIQARVDELYGVFVDTVARNRNLDAAAVRATEALTFTATEAIENKLADSIGALDAALAEFEADILNTDEGDETMTTITVASVKADHPEVATALIAEGKEQGAAEAKAGNAQAVTAAVAADRERCAQIDALAAPYAGNAKVIEITTAAKKDGTSAADTALKLMTSGAAANATVLGAIQQDDATAKAATPAKPGDTAQKPTTPEGWKAEYEGSATLQAEFPSAEAYVAFKKDEAKNGGAK
jgi:signal peptide peptidase SppA